MCGIAGVLYHDSRPVAPVRLRGMADAISHRGPDADGFWAAPGIGLAHRRLAILDLSGGDQPIGNEDGTVQVVFNGEIYNFKKLRRELLAKGHRFTTNSDTEVLVHLYEEHGESFVERLRGMFAFALWDANEERLVLARDHVGQKPLYVYRDEEKLVFGSELKAILAHGDVDRSIEATAVADYLTHGFVPSPRSIFRRVEKLPAAHVVTIQLGNREFRPRRFWNLEFSPDTSRTVDDWLREIDDKIRETVAAHRIADVPVGAFLSGGIDSSAMVACLSDADGEPLRTFSIGFEERRFDELPFARQVAQRFGTRHVERIVAPEAAGCLDELVHHYDEPFADASAVPTMLVCRVAAEDVKVVVSGDGGDEAFGGYSRYAHDLLEARLRSALPGWFRANVLCRIAQSWPTADWLPRPLRWRSALENLASDPASAYARTMSRVPPAFVRRLLSPTVRRSIGSHDPSAYTRDAYGDPARDPLSGMLQADIATVLPDDFLVKVDRASMAYGLEVRPPFVDHQLLELAATMPSEFKVRRGETKWLLKQLFAPRLPDGLVARRKQGFEMPIDRWLRGPLRDAFEANVLHPNAAIAALIDQTAAGNLFAAHCAGTARRGDVLWSLLVLGAWCEKYLAGPQQRALGGLVGAEAR